MAASTFDFQPETDSFDFQAEASPKTYLPEVNKAVATVPSPTRLLDVAAAYPGTIPSKVPANWTGMAIPSPKVGLPEAAGVATELLAPGTVMPGRLDESPAQTVKTGVRELQTPGQRGTGALRTTSGVLDAAAPLAGPMAVENPFTFARAMAEGYAGGKAAKAGAKGLGATPAQQDLAEDIGQMSPILAHAALQPEAGVETTPEGTRAAGTVFGGKAGAGVAVTPEGVTVRGKVGPFEGSKTFARAAQPVPAIEPPTIEASPTEVQQAVASAARAQQAEIQAQRVARGLPAVEPPPPAPKPEPLPEITPKDVAAESKKIASLPKEQQAPAIIQAHGELSKELLQQGKIVTPDGQLHIVKTPDQADTLAAKIVNDEISKQKEEKPPSQSDNGNAMGKARVAAKSVVERPNFEFIPEPQAPPFKEGERVTLPSGGTGTIKWSGIGGDSKPVVRGTEDATGKTFRLTADKVSLTNEGIKVPAELQAIRDKQISEPRPGSIAPDIGEWKAPPELGVSHAPDYGQRARVEVEQAMGGPLKRGIESAPVPPERGAGEKSAQTPQETPAGAKFVDAVDDRGRYRKIGNAIDVNGNWGRLKDLSDDSDVVLYHATTEANAKKILAGGFNRGEKPTNFGGDRNYTYLGGYNEGHGLGSYLGGATYGGKPVVVVAKVKKSLLEPDRGSDWKRHFKANPGERQFAKRNGISVDSPSAVDTYAVINQVRARNEHVEPLGIIDPKTHEFTPKSEASSAPVKGAATQPDEKKVEGVVPAEHPKKEEVAPGKVGEMKVSDLKVAPNKFQYKLGTDAAGTSALLKEAKTFNPDLAGTISVWRDPADGKTYVVNGHHRYELAQRTGQKQVAVRHVVAKDIAEARAVGARQNIAEGRGTPVDAAKFFRDTSVTPEDLEKHGISLGEATASKGLALSHLDDSLFSKVVKGDLREGRAVAIGEATKDHAEQKAILSLVEKKEARGAKVSDDTLSELIRLVKGSEQTTETTANLFGTQEITRSLALEKAEISAHIKQQLAKDKKLFGFVAKEGRATELERAGNKIDVERSKEISTGAAQAEEVYNKLSERGGPISAILDESARRLADGENASTVKSEAYARVRAEVSKTLGGTEREIPQGLEAGAGRNEVAEAGTRQQESPVAPTLPGMEHVPAERAEANAEHQGKELTEKLTEPPKSIEAKAGEIEQKSPLFRDTEANPQQGLFSGESGSLTPSALNPSRIKALYKDFIDQAIDKKLDIGDKYRRVAEHDPVIAKMLKEKDNAPRYFHDKAESNIHQATKGLSEDQIRLTAMMADSDAREYLEKNHPEQYKQALDDSAVVSAVEKFKQYQDQLAALRISLGWHVRRDMSIFEDESGKWKVLDRDGQEVEGEEFKSAKSAQAYVEEHGKVLDHLKRTYPEHLREPLMGTTSEGPGLSASYGGIRPPKPDKKQRLASAQYFYDHGAKDFSGYLKSYTQAAHAALNKKIYDSLTDEATPWREGTAQPSSIEYRGKTYFSPLVAKSMKTGTAKPVLEYRAYDPARDDKALIRDFENGWSTQTTGRPGIGPLDRYLAPKDVVEALDQYDMTRGVKENDSIRRFFQDQIVGLFGPNIHILNIMRRLATTVGSGAWDPRVWPYYQKLFFSKELRDRMAQELADQAVDSLSKWGSYTNSRDIGSLHEYFLGNLNPANWVRQTIGKFSKGLLFDPKFMGGLGGLDQKSRVLAYDFLKDHGMGEEEAAKNVEDGFGNYNRANWSERMKRWARALLFPGWDFSSLKWFLRHPVKTAFLPAVATLGANLALNKAGKNKDSDKYDYAYIHYGDRKYRTGLITESMAMHIAEPILEAGKSALEGGEAREIAGAAGQGALRGGGGMAGNLRPEIQAAAELLSNRQYMGGEKEVWKPEDANIPGKVLPTRKLDKMATFAVVKALPAISRFLDSSYANADLATGAGSIVGVTNYRSGAEERLRANEAKAMGYSQTLSKLNETDPEAAGKFVSDPNKAAYLMFNEDFSKLAKDLKDIDQQIVRVKLTDMKYEERRAELKDLTDDRAELLQSADAVDAELAKAKKP